LRSFIHHTLAAVEADSATRQKFRLLLVLLK